MAGAIGLFGAIASCLNPRPDELPGNEDRSEPQPTTSGERETCDDHALLGGCESPDNDISGKPIQAPASSVPESGNTAPESPADPSAGAGAANGGDMNEESTAAGADAGAPPPDGGAP